MENISEIYRIISSLGSQKKRKFGQVFLVENKITLEKYVLKSNNKTSAKTNEIDQLRREQQFSFEHKDLPNVIDFFENDTEIFLVKNYQEGISLDEFWLSLKRKERVPFTQLFVKQLLEILDNIHAQHIYHCDLKPSNILVHQKENDFGIELIDFGLAIQQPMTEKRKLLFPLGYAAPELLLNELDLVNSTTDYFSLGIILWKLWNNELPLMHPNPSIYTNLQLTHPMEDMVNLPKGLFEIINKLTQKPKFKTAPNRMKLEDVKTELKDAQERRYQNSTEIIIDLKIIKPRKILGLF